MSPADAFLTVTDLHYGLVDDTRPPMVDDQNGQPVAHLAVRHDAVEPIGTGGDDE